MREWDNYLINKFQIMDRLILNGTDGFPLYTDTLEEAQRAWSIINAFCGIVGDKAIISGCVQTGSHVSDGFIVLNGEVFPFKGGTLGQNIFIKEEITEREFKDKSRKPVFIARIAVFGSSTPDKTYPWVDFVRVENLIENNNKHADFEARLQALEAKKSPVPIGLIAIWGKPATEPIPEGWRECTDLRGRFPLGWNPNDVDFNTVGAIGGEKKHRLTIEEMPRHAHGLTVKSNIDGHDAHSGGFDGGRHPFRWHNINTHEQGGNQPHNNMPPYRVIRFIEFVGFN